MRRCLAAASTRHRLKQVETRKGRIAALPVFRTDHDSNVVDARMIDEIAHRMAQDDTVAKRQILLGKFRAQARAAPAGEDESDTARHFVPVRLRGDPNRPGIYCQGRLRSAQCSSIAGVI